MMGKHSRKQNLSTFNSGEGRWQEISKFLAAVLLRNGALRRWSTVAAIDRLLHALFYDKPGTAAHQEAVARLLLGVAQWLDPSLFRHTKLIV